MVLSLATRFILISCYGAVFLAGLIGNSALVLVIATSKNFRKLLPNSLTANLAAADFLLCLVNAPYFITGLALTSPELPVETNKLPEKLCKCFIMFSYVFGFARILLLALMSLERYIAILHPFFYGMHGIASWGRVKICCTVGYLWLQAIATTSPAVLMKGWVKYKGDSTSLCEYAWDTSNLGFFIPVFVINFVIPAIIIFYTNCRVYIVARRQNGRRVHVFPSKENSEQALEDIPDHIGGSSDSSVEGNRGINAKSRELGKVFTVSKGNPACKTTPNSNAIPSGRTTPNSRTVPDESPLPNEIRMPSETAIPNESTIPYCSIVQNGNTISTGSTIPDGSVIPVDNVIPIGIGIPNGSVLPNGNTVPNDSVLPNCNTVPNDSTRGRTKPNGSTIPKGSQMPRSNTIPNSNTLRNGSIIRNEAEAASDGSVIPNGSKTPYESIIPNDSSVTYGSKVANDNVASNDNGIPNGRTVLDKSTVSNEIRMPSETAIPNESAIPYCSTVQNCNTISTGSIIPYGSVIPNVSVLPNVNTVPNDSEIPDNGAIPNGRNKPVGSTIPNGSTIPRSSTLPNSCMLRSGGVIHNEAAADGSVMPYGSETPYERITPNDSSVTYGSKVANDNILSTDNGIPNGSTMRNDSAIPNCSTVSNANTIPNGSTISNKGTTVMSPLENDLFGPENYGILSEKGFSAKAVVQSSMEKSRSSSSEQSLTRSNKKCERDVMNSNISSTSCSSNSVDKIETISDLETQNQNSESHKTSLEKTTNKKSSRKLRRATNRYNFSSKLSFMLKNKLEDRRRRNDLRVFFSTLSVVTLFFATWLPFVITAIIEMAIRKSLPVEVDLFTSVLTIMNSAIAPYVVFGTRREIRKHLLKLISRK